MKKTIITLTLLGSLATLSAQADTTTPPSTTAAPAATVAQPAPQPAAKPVAKPATAPKKQESSHSNSSGSVYDSIRSGWNGFIDVLTGTKGSSQ